MTKASKSEPAVRGVVLLLKVDEISTRDQVRTEFDEAEDNGLAESVKKYGVLQPVSVYKDDGEWVLRYGHRRLAAAINAGLSEIPAIEVDKLNLPQLRTVQLIENLERAGMSLLDTSNAVRAVYNDAPAPKVENTAAALGRSKPWVSKMLLISSPTKATTVARRLMTADKIADVEMAYVMCQIEEASPLLAVEAEAEIDHHTRATLKKVLTKARKLAKEEAEAPEEGDGEEGGESSGSRIHSTEDGEDEEAIRLEWDFDLLDFARRLVADAVVKPNDLERKKALEDFLAAEQQFLMAEIDGQ